MLARTWPYGTRKAVKVAGVGTQKGVPYAVCVETCDNGEVFVLLGMEKAAAKDDEGYIEFKDGGPTGGFWEFHKGSPIITGA